MSLERFRRQDKTIRLSVVIEPAGAPTALVVDPPDGTTFQRVEMVPVPGRDARRETYAFPSRYLGWGVTVSAWADGYTSQARHQYLGPGLQTMPEIVLEHAVPTGPPIWGNFLAAPGFQLDGPGEIPGLMYGAMSPEQRKAFRDMYRAHGWRTLPIHPTQSYRHWAYDYSKDLPAYRDVLQEAIADGLEPLGMVMNWRQEGWTLDQAKHYIDDTLPTLMDLYPHVCFGWESNDISEVGVSEDTLVLQQQIRQIVGPTKPTWLHVAPRWWSPTPRLVDSMDEWAYWEAVGSDCDGLLLQLDPNDTDEHARIVTYDMYPIHGTAGLAGRLVEALHRKCAVFEFARTWPEWQRLHAALSSHPKASLLEGYC